jgi:hypothetical protein
MMLVLTDLVVNMMSAKGTSSLLLVFNAHKNLIGFPQNNHFLPRARVELLFELEGLHARVEE